MKRALITGASSGIGQAIANRFIQHGYNVLSPTHQELDLSSVDSINKYVKGLEVDILINNAAENIVCPISDLSIDNWRHTLDVNLTAPLMLIRHLSDYMMCSRWGRIVNISSCYSLITKRGRVSYSASKAGINSLTRTAALEYAEYNILVNAVCLGFCDTEMTKQNNSPKQIDVICNQIPLHRLGTPQEIAEFVYFIGSEQNTYITGQTLIIDGGFMARG